MKWKSSRRRRDGGRRTIGGRMVQEEFVVGKL